jgi:hypothetical protein
VSELAVGVDRQRLVEHVLEDGLQAGEALAARAAAVRLDRPVLGVEVLGEDGSVGGQLRQAPHGLAGRLSEPVRVPRAVDRLVGRLASGLAGELHEVLDRRPRRDHRRPAGHRRLPERLQRRP